MSAHKLLKTTWLLPLPSLLLLGLLCTIIRLSMPITTEDLARQNIDRLLGAAGWIIQDRAAANITAGRGVAIREFPMKKGHGEADYLLFVDGAAAGVIEAPGFCLSQGRNTRAM